MQLTQSSGGFNENGALGTPLHCAICGVPLLVEVSQYRGSFSEWNWTGFGNRLPSGLTLSTLLEMGADLHPSFRTLDGLTITTTLMASQTGHLESVIGAGAVLDQDTADFLLDGMSLKNDVSFLHGIDIRNIAERDRPSVIRLLRELGQSAEAIQSIPLDVNNRSELSPEHEQILVDACRTDDIRGFKWLFENLIVSVNHKFLDWTLLHLACAYSSISVAEYLVSKGADINAHTIDSTTPLGYLLSGLQPVQRSLVPTLEMLLASGARLTDIDEEKSNVLMCWTNDHCPHGDQAKILGDALSLLASSQTNPPLRDKKGRSLWHILAANSDGHHLVEMLKATVVYEGMQDCVEVFDEAGLTPLHVAVSNGHDKIMHILMDHGSRPTSRLRAAELSYTWRWKR